MCLQALFWQQHNFFGVDLTPLHGSAFQGYFSQVTSHSTTLYFAKRYIYTLFGFCTNLYCRYVCL
jgi:hypothetical protein